MFSVACIALIIWMVIYFLIVISGARLTPKALMFYWMFLVIAYATFSFYAEPSVSDDLFRHYQIIDQLRAGMSIEGHFTDTMLIFKLLLILVSKTSNNGWLPFITILIWGHLIGRVLVKYLKQNEYKTRVILLYFMALIGAFFSFNLVSGIRTALVTAIFLHSSYYNYLEGKRIKHYCVMLLFSLLHIVSLLYLVIQLTYELIVYMRKRGIRILWIVIIAAAILFSTNIVGEVFAGRMGLFGFIAEKWNGYRTWTRELTFELVLYWSSMLYVLLSGFIIRKAYKKDDFRFEFPQLFVLYSIATNVMPIVANRMPMPTAAFAFPILCVAYQKIKTYKALWLFVGFTIFTVQAVYMLYAMFGFISFNGVNIQEFIKHII